MKFKFRKRYFFLIFIAAIVIYLFWGPLFPWSPLKIGFTKIESSIATIYIEDYEGESAVHNIEEIIRDEERFHALKFKEKFKIIILGKESSMKRFLPWMRGSDYSVKLGYVNVIYIGPFGRFSQYGLEAYMKHEISHLLIHQNVTSGNFEILNQGWLSEGTATYFGGPHFYEKNEFINLWKESGRGFGSLYEENPLVMDRDIITLKYTYYRFFVEFLINTYGLEKFQAYLNSYINDPKNYKPLFSDIYHEDVDEILRKYSSYMGN